MEEKLSVYIHIPFCLSKCSYCDFFSIVCKNKIPDEYITAICNEINSYKSKHYIVDTIYFGGGTPSLLYENQLQKIFLFLNECFNIVENCEISFEANPDDLNIHLLKTLENLGVNRISCGIQTLNEKSLNYVSRRANVTINKNAIDLLNLHWKKDFSLDLICGLPYETKSTFLDGLSFVENSNVNHISLYSLTVEEKTSLGNSIFNGKLDYDFDKTDELWILGKKHLENHGFFQYEVSNFCKKNKECKHNLKYWNHKQYLGIGAGATGTFYEQTGKGIRFTNIDNIEQYINFWSKNDFSCDIQTKELIDTETSIFEFFMMGLRKIGGINESDFIQIFNQEIPKKIKTTFYEWQKKGLCKINETEKTYTLGKNGILFLNKFLEEIV